MKKKENYLRGLCNRLYGIGAHSKPTLEFFRTSDRYEEICNIYKALGGVLDTPPVNPGAWDIDTPSFIIELDEENHFNRYRAITLDAPLYQNFKNFDVKEYRKYCRSYESKCPKTQGRWSKPSADVQFGASGPEGDFSGNGPSRWKQRAFYDYLKDVFSVLTGIPVIRISIYDKAGYSTVGQLLDEENGAKIKQHLNSRIESINKQ